MPESSSHLSRYVTKALIFAVAFLCASAILAAFWAERQSKTHRIVYRLLPPGGKPTPQMLSLAAEVMSARLQNLKGDYALRDCNVEATAENQIRVQFRTRFEADEVLMWLKMRGQAQFRLLHPDPRILEKSGLEQLPEGYELKTYREVRYRLARPGELKTTEHHFAAEKQASIKVPGFSSVSLETRGLHKKTVLTFELRPAEAESLKRLTAVNPGRQMAMLIDDELFFPPREIQGPIQGTKVQVVGYFYNPPLRKLVKVLSGGTLPCSLEEVPHEET